jgi:tRNA(Ile)-lysidine synthase
MAARELRYQWFAQLAMEHNCQAIAVAHHQNDQAETVLLNLKRGTGLRGLCGMRPKSENPMGGSVPVIRPLLCTTRDYIEHYLRDIRHIAWVNDSTNTDTTITRNAVRAQLANYS